MGRSVVKGTPPGRHHLRRPLCYASHRPKTDYPHIKKRRYIHRFGDLYCGGYSFSVGLSQVNEQKKQASKQGDKLTRGELNALIRRQESSFTLKRRIVRRKQVYSLACQLIGLSTFPDIILYETKGHPTITYQPISRRIDGFCHAHHCTFSCRFATA